MKNFVLIIMVLFINSLIFSASLIRTQKVAKVGNEIILKTEVDKFADYYKVDYQKALETLVENALLYNGAKVYAEEPTEEEIDDVIKKQKSYYASLKGKDLRTVSDEEFLSYLHFNNQSMINYRKDIKRSVWIKKFVYQKLDIELAKPYYPTDNDVQSFIKDNPEYFLEKEGVLLSMIYFSAYNENGENMDFDQLKIQRKKAELCYKELLDGEKFEDMVLKYSDDIISKKNTPPGQVGYVFFDDPRVGQSFNEEIIEALKITGKGFVQRIFETKEGNYIFYINEKLDAEKLTDESAIIKARDLIISKRKDKLQDLVRDQLVEEMRAKVQVELF